MADGRIRVLLVDDNEDLVLILSRLIDSQSDMETAGTLPSADDLTAHALRLEPDVALVDLTMPGRPALDAVIELGDRAPHTRALVFSGHDDPNTVEAAAAAGAWGLVSKHGDPGDVIESIRRVARGNTCYPWDRSPR